MEVRLDLPPDEALAFFRQKGLEPTFAWQDMLHAEHDSAFTVAKMMDVDLLRETREAVDTAIAEGQTLAQFRENIEPTLFDRGWWGRKRMVDPQTGEVRTVQLGSPRRLRTIFETNLKTAYAAGHWSKIQETRDEAPYLQYDAVDDAATRDEHADWNGLVLRADDAWWASHYPPNGWGCRCSVIQLSERDLEQLGKSGPDDPPPSQTRQWTNPRTGEVIDVPRGVDPGWGYHPGRRRAQRVRDGLNEKVRQTGPDAAGAEALVDDAPDPPAGLFNRRDEVFTTNPRVDQSEIDVRLASVPEARPQLARLHRFLERHPQRAVFVSGAEMRPGSRAARGVADPVRSFLGEPGARFGQAAFTARGAAGANGWTSPDFDHVVVKVNRRDRLQVTGEQLREGARAAVRDHAAGRPAWTFSARTAQLTGVDKSIPTTLVHELGHQVHYWAGAPDRPSGLGRVDSLTRYGATNKREWHAEHFTAWLLDREGLAEWSPDVAEYFDDLVERAAEATEKARR